MSQRIHPRIHSKGKINKCVQCTLYVYYHLSLFINNILQYKRPNCARFRIPTKLNLHTLNLIFYLWSRNEYHSRSFKADL